MRTDLSPVRQNERILLLDALRGLAIFGILMVNMPLMFEPVTSLLLGAKPVHSLHEVIAGSFIRFFFEGKFYVLFSFLFGYGFWLFLNKSGQELSDTLPLYRRRLFALMLFGLAHIALLWAGDILVIYSLYGFILILFRNSSNRKIIRWAVGIALFPLILNGLMTLMLSLLSNMPEAREAIESNTQQRLDSLRQICENAAAAYSSGSFSAMVSMRFSEYATLLPGIIFFYPVVLAMFLTGTWAARNRIIADFEMHQPFFRKMFWWGLGIGLPANILFVIAYLKADMQAQDIWAWLYSVLHVTGGISLSAVYVSSMVLLLAKGKAGCTVKWLAPVGRMALTNYLMQSLITAVLFMGWGFGWFGKVQIWQGILFSITIFVMQISLSRWWLTHFRFGPVEWLWRTLTYGRTQPMRLP